MIDLSSLFSTFTKILSPGVIIVISGPTENFVYSIARKFPQLGLKGNLKGKDEHLRDSFEIKNRILEAGFKVHKDVNLWNLFRVISFKMENWFYIQIMLGIVITHNQIFYTSSWSYNQFCYDS